MKTYLIPGSNGKSYTLSGVTDGVKETIEDIVQAHERVRLHRQLRKGLIPQEVFIVEQQAIQSIHFTTEPVLVYIATLEGNKRFIRELMIAGGRLPDPTDADVEAVYKAQTVEGSLAWTTARQIWEDAYPKGQTLPPTTASETTGGGNSTTTQSASDLTTSAA